MEDRSVHDLLRWSATGCMSLTGPECSGGLGPPASLVAALDDVAARLNRFAPSRGASVHGLLPGCSQDTDVLELLSMRAACNGSSRHGRTSCRGSTRLLPSRDGWVAVALPREEDVGLVPALVESNPVPDGDRGVWHAVATWCAARTSAEIVARGVLLGLAVAALPPEPRVAPEAPGLHGRRTAIAGPPTRRGPLDTIVVVDLSSLWAGPLCGALLAAAGCIVLKVESSARPDGARRGPAQFFAVLNAGKRSVALDLRSRDGVGELRRVIATADVVIEASRPRALQQMGVVAEEMIASGPAVWVSITGHGRCGSDGERIGFGDDAAVAGGLVADDGSGPWFCADAIADPLTGITAAAEVLAALARGGRWHLDVALARVAAHATGPTLPVPPGVTAALPRLLHSPAPAPPLGADTAWALERSRATC